MGFLNKEGLQNLTNKLVKGEAIKVASSRGTNVEEVINNIKRECEAVNTPNKVDVINNSSNFIVGQGSNINVSRDVEIGTTDISLKGKTYQNLCGSSIYVDQANNNYYDIKHVPEGIKVTYISDTPDTSWFYWYNDRIKINMLKPNTYYTLFFKIDTRKKDNVFIAIQKGNATGTLAPLTSSVKIQNNLYRVVLKTVPSFDGITIDNQVIYFYKYNPKVKGEEITFHKDMILLEGDHSNLSAEEIPQYFEDIQSSFENGIVDIKVDNQKYKFDIKEPLRGLPSGIGDTIENNKIIRRVKKHIIDNTSEIWKWEGESVSGHTVFVIKKIPDIKMSPPEGQGTTDYWCDKLLISKVGHEFECIQFWYNWHIDVLTSKLKDDSIESFKEWLKNNPITVYYELIEPIVEDIESIKFNINPLDTITIDSNISPESTHTVILNRAGQIEEGILQIAELKERIDNLENNYNSLIIENQHRLNLLKLDYNLESEEE